MRFEDILKEAARNKKMEDAEYKAVLKKEKDLIDKFSSFNFNQWIVISILNEDELGGRMVKFGAKSGLSEIGLCALALHSLCNGSIRPLNIYPIVSHELNILFDKWVFVAETSNSEIICVDSGISLSEVTGFFQKIIN